MSKLRDLLRKLKRAKNDLPKLKAAIAREITKEVKDRIDKQLLSGAGYAPISPDTPKFNSQHRAVRRGGGVPLIDSGRLRDSIRVETRNNSSGFTITATAETEYARFLQFGGTTPLNTKVPGRPFISLAFESIGRLTIGKIAKRHTQDYLKYIFKVG